MSSVEDVVPLGKYFKSLEDPRIDRAKRHELIDIIGITISAVVCGADNWVEVEEFGKAKEEWLRGFLKLPNGIPSHDTFGRVFSRLAPERFGECFMSWVRSISELTRGEVVAIDGKTLRGCHDRSNGRAALHMVSAWASENHLVLGQTRTADHSNEITAIPKLLSMLELKGCIITIDAMGCQKEIARQITDGGSDYILSVKSNQGELNHNVRDVFECSERDGFNGVAHSYQEQVNKDHGRLETRRCWMITDRDQLAYIDPGGEWSGLKGVAKLSYERHSGAGTVDTRYYICSFQADAQAILKATRGHWGIENSLHWVLDVAFDEDRSRVRTGNADQNLAVVRHMAVNMLKRETTAKVGIKAKRKKAGWDYHYLLKVLYS